MLYKDFIGCQKNDRCILIKNCYIFLYAKGIEMSTFFIETIGWISTGLFLISIIAPKRLHLHSLGIFTSVTTGYYAFMHDATAIWVKWAIAFFFHLYMWFNLKKQNQTLAVETNA